MAPTLQLSLQKQALAYSEKAQDKALVASKTYVSPLLEQTSQNNNLYRAHSMA